MVFLAPLNKTSGVKYSFGNDLTMVSGEDLAPELSKALQFDAVSDIILAFHECEHLNIYCPASQKYKYVTLDDFRVIEVTLKTKTVKI